MAGVGFEPTESGCKVYPPPPPGTIDKQAQCDMLSTNLEMSTFPL